MSQTWVSEQFSARAFTACVHSVPVDVISLVDFFSYFCTAVAKEDRAKKWKKITEFRFNYDSNCKKIVNAVIPSLTQLSEQFSWSKLLNTEFVLRLYSPISIGIYWFFHTLEWERKIQRNDKRVSRCELTSFFISHLRVNVGYIQDRYGVAKVSRIKARGDRYVLEWSQEIINPRGAINHKRKGVKPDLIDGLSFRWR